jgi:hypothetical protein
MTDTPPRTNPSKYDGADVLREMSWEMKKIIARTSFGVFFLTAFVLGQTAPTKWKGTIATENGVKVVRNPAEPLYGTFAFDLEEDLVFGGDPTKEDYYFPKGGVLSVDDDGNMYVADFGNRRVHVYDLSGKFIRPLGRRGQGPGEYTFPSRVLFDPEGNPCIWGGRELIYYGKDGSFKKKILIKAPVTYCLFGPKGTILGTTQPGLGPGGPKYALVQLDAEGAPLRTVAEYRGEFKENQTVIILHAYSNRISFAPLTSETFVYGFSEAYRINVADIEGRTSLIIAKDEKPQSISGKEKDEIRENGIYAMIGSYDKKLVDDMLPDHRPFFGGFFNDDAGRIYVVRSGSILEKNAPRQIDVFSKDGYYLYAMAWSDFPSAIKAGFLYQFREDKETGEYQVVRHTIKNWDRMKTAGKS